jgi:hypothetical protein
MSIAAPLAAPEQRLQRRDAVAAKQIFFSPTLVLAIGVERSVHAYLVGLVADDIEIFPLAASKTEKKVAKTGRASSLGIKRRDANREIEASEGAPGLPGLRAKLLNE